MRAVLHLNRSFAWHSPERITVLLQLLYNSILIQYLSRQ
jgi:hypothetical protein